MICVVYSKSLFHVFLYHISSFKSLINSDSQDFNLNIVYVFFFVRFGYLYIIDHLEDNVIKMNNLISLYNFKC